MKVSLLASIVETSSSINAPENSKKVFHNNEVKRKIPRKKENRAKNNTERDTMSFSPVTLKNRN